MKHPSPRWCMAAAAALLVLSLGLPWANALVWRTFILPDRFVPSICRVVQNYDGWYESVCEPSVLLPGLVGMAPHAQTHHGAQHEGRFGVAAGLVLIAFAWRRQRRHYLLLAAAAVSTVTVLSSGLGFASAGSGAAWLAVILLVAAGLTPTAPGSGPLSRKRRAAPEFP